MLINDEVELSYDLSDININAVDSYVSDYLTEQKTVFKLQL